MASYKFEILASGGSVNATVSSDGVLEICNFNPEYEETISALGSKPSPAHLLFSLWERLVTMAGYFEPPFMDVMIQMISKCPMVVAHRPLEAYAMEVDRAFVFISDLNFAVLHLLESAFDDCDESVCIGIAKFIRDSGPLVYGSHHIHPWLQEYQDGVTYPNKWTTVFKEERYLVCDGFSIGPWYRYSQCEITDIFYFNRRSSEISGIQKIGKTKIGILKRILEIVGIKERPCDDACSYSPDPPYPLNAGSGDYAIMYYRHASLNKIPYSKKFDEALVQYGTIAEMNHAYDIATSMDVVYGNCYHIRRMKRIPDTKILHEDWQHITEEGRQQYMGSFRNWVAQCWTEY